jgi:hypothetical protein
VISIIYNINFSKFEIKFGHRAKFIGGEIYPFRSILIILIEEIIFNLICQGNIIDD